METVYPLGVRGRRQPFAEVAIALPAVAFAARLRDGALLVDIDLDAEVATERLAGMAPRAAGAVRGQRCALEASTRRSMRSDFFRAAGYICATNRADLAASGVGAAGLRAPSADCSISLRRAVAANAAAPVDVLPRLLADEDPEVRQAALRGLPPRVRARVRPRP